MRLPPLTHQKNISAEMRSVYRDTRKGSLPIIDGKTLMQMLKLISDQMATNELEERVVLLERINREGNP